VRVIWAGRRQQVAECPPSDLGQAALWPILEARHASSCEPGGEAPSHGKRLCEVWRVAEGDERDNVDDAESRVDALVPTQIEQIHSAPRQASDGRLEGPCVSVGNSEDGAVMDRVAVNVEQAGTCCSSKFGENDRVATFADVDDALEHRHVLRVGARESGTRDEPTANRWRPGLSLRRGSRQATTAGDAPAFPL
jgi:hypothetical protein